MFIRQIRASSVETCTDFHGPSCNEICQEISEIFLPPWVAAGDGQRLLMLSFSILPLRTPKRGRIPCALQELQDAPPPNDGFSVLSIEHRQVYFCSIGLYLGLVDVWCVPYKRQPT